MFDFPTIVSTLTSSAAATPAATTPLAPDTTAFAPVLAALVGTSSGGAAPTLTLPKRQHTAENGDESGKTPPGDEDEACDPVLVWLPAITPPPAPPAPTAPSAQSLSVGQAPPQLALAPPLANVAATPAALPATSTPALPVSADPIASVAPPALDPALPPPPGETGVTITLHATDRPPATAIATPPEVKIPKSLSSLANPPEPTSTKDRGFGMMPRIEALPVVAPVASIPTAPSQPQPAGILFAAAIAAAAGRSGRDGGASPSAELLAGPVAIMAESIAAPVVHAANAAQGTPLDLTQDPGLQGMIEHIEMLRDDADAQDTHIRLVPDALGGVDIALRSEGETVHVRFTAETALARTLLTEAQPRLVELAEARGLKLGDASVEGGARDAPPPRFVQQPEPVARAPAPVAEDQPLDTETHRLA